MPAMHVCNGAKLKCALALPPGMGSLVVLPLNRTLTNNQPAATIMDHVPMLNIMPFGACTSPTNPAVIAALGAPAPCVPVTPMPWAPGAPTVMLGNFPVLNNTSVLTCMMGGVITVVEAGQQKELTP